MNMDYVTISHNGFVVTQPFINNGYKLFFTNSSEILADEVIVMYLGKIIESAPVKKLFLNPKHPYTQGLLESIPALNKKSADELFQIHGNVPNPLNVIKGCGFFSRCTKAMDICKNQKPNKQTIEKNHITSCWLYE